MAKGRLLYSDNPYDMGLTEEYARESWMEWHDEEPTDEQLWNYIYEDIQSAFEDFAYSMKHFMDGKTFVLIGTLGLWDGTYHVGAIVRGWDDLIDKMSMSGSYDMSFEDVAGKLIITQSHHDGTNIFEMRELTDKGIKKVDASYGVDKDLIDALGNIKCYTKNANYAKVVWGC